MGALESRRVLGGRGWDSVGRDDAKELGTGQKGMLGIFHFWLSIKWDQRAKKI